MNTPCPSPLLSAELRRRIEADVHIFVTPGGEELVVLAQSVFRAMLDTLVQAESLRKLNEGDARHRRHAQPSALSDVVPPQNLTKPVQPCERNRLKVCREWRGMTRGDLAQLTGLPRNLIGTLETGQVRMTSQYAGPLAIALGVPRDWIL